jgi:hypothetical protein
MLNQNLVRRGLVVALLAASAPAAYAQQYVERELTVGASSACVPFFSATQARYSATGMRNAGTSQFYASCSAQAGWGGDHDSGSRKVDIVARNLTDAPVKVSCTLRPGYVEGSSTSQGSFPQSYTIPAGAQHWFEWYRSSMWPESPELYIANPNFTCTVPAGVEITHLNLYMYENVGN